MDNINDGTINEQALEYARRRRMEQSTNSVEVKTEIKEEVTEEPVVSVESQVEEPTVETKTEIKEEVKIEETSTPSKINTDEPAVEVDIPVGNSEVWDEEGIMTAGPQVPYVPTPVQSVAQPTVKTTTQSSTQTKVNTTTQSSTQPNSTKSASVVSVDAAIENNNKQNHKRLRARLLIALFTIGGLIAIFALLKGCSKSGDKGNAVPTSTPTPTPTPTSFFEYDEGSTTELILADAPEDLYAPFTYGGKTYNNYFTYVGVATGQIKDTTTINRITYPSDQIPEEYKFTK